MIRLGFGSFLDASVQKTDVGNSFNDCFTVNSQDQAQHSMGAGMLWTHIDGHRIIPLLIDYHAGIGRILIFYLLLLHTCVLFDDADLFEAGPGLVSRAGASPAP